jgi:site-specific DNA recombinase
MSAQESNPLNVVCIVCGESVKCVSSQAQEFRLLLRSFLRKVIVHDDRIELLIGRPELCQALGGLDFKASDKARPDGYADPNDTICLSMEAKRKRRDGVVHLVIPPNVTGPIRHPRPALIKAVARARAWYEKILNGQVLDIKSLAGETGLTPHYVRNVLGCAFLAPDIVEAILDGRQPEALKFEHLYKHIPLSWLEQRKRFGFVPITPL